jgi:hypothetical protein
MMGSNGAMFAGGKKKFKAIQKMVRRERQAHMAAVNKQVDAEEQRREEKRDTEDV